MEFRILGPLEVRGEAGVVELRGAKLRAILAMLLLHANEPVSAERLALGLWGEDVPDGAVRTVHVHVSRLRKALGGSDPVATTPDGYRLRVAPGEFDAERFSRLVDDGRRALAAGRAELAAHVLGTALALWRGPALAEPAFEPFAGEEIARLEEQRLDALELRLEADLAAGRHAALVGELQQLVRAHPTHERLVGQLMRALYRCGRQVDALATYHDTRRALVDELGIEPSRDLRWLHEAMLSQDAALEPGPGAGGATWQPGREQAAIRIVVADDGYLIREGVRRLLETQAGVEVVATCGDLDTLLRAVDAEHPDVVVTDIRMPPTGSDEGIRAAERLRTTHPDTGVIVLSQFANPEFALALLKEGSARRAYLLKERIDDLEQLMSAIRAVASGGSAIDPKVVESLVAAETRQEDSRLGKLTPRESQVLAEMAKGKTNAAIAAALAITEPSVEKYVHAIFQKLGLTWQPEVHRRVTAVLLFLSEQGR